MLVFIIQEGEMVCQMCDAPDQFAGGCERTVLSHSLLHLQVTTDRES